MILFQPKLKIYRVMHYSALKSIVITFRIELSEAQRADALLVEIVSVNSLLIVQRYHFYAKELSEFYDERYLFILSF